MVVGDRAETDILMAKNEGMYSTLVLSGVEKRENIKIKPDFIIDSIKELPELIINITQQ